jgi:hypothetical protein
MLSGIPGSIQRPQNLHVIYIFPGISLIHDALFFLNTTSQWLVLWQKVLQKIIYTHFPDFHQNFRPATSVCCMKLLHDNMVAHTSVTVHEFLRNSKLDVLWILHIALTCQLVTLFFLTAKVNASRVLVKIWLQYCIVK